MAKLAYRKPFKVAGRKHPAELFIRYWLLANWDPEKRADVETLNTELTELQLVSVDSDYLEALEDMLVEELPDNFMPDDTHESSMEYIDESGLTALFFPTPEVDGAYRLAVSRRHRKALNVAVAAFPDDEEVAEGMLLRFPDIEITEDEVKFFRQFFWNTNVMGQKDWREYMEDDPELRPLMAAHKYGRHNGLYALGLHEKADARWVTSAVTSSLMALFFELDVSMPATPEKGKALTKLGAQILRNVNSIKESENYLEEMRNLYDKISLAQEQRAKITSIDALIGDKDVIVYDDRN
jgi:hypothetical protein